VNDIARIDDTKWLIGGRYSSAAGYAAVYEPLMWRLEPLPVGPGAFVSCAAKMERQIATAVGRGGEVLTLFGDRQENSVIPGNADCASAAVDVSGQQWAGSMGRIYSRAGQGSWSLAWQGPLRAPFTSLHADVDIVHALTADGAVLEGRADSS
jgi:hypothetical protein